MYNKNVPKILSQIKEGDIVLDIGGWFCPFNRADWVIDVMPYATRGKGGCCGGSREYFSNQTWIQRNICDKQPFPFRDKEIDFVICSHTLEDIRDPLFVCSEICRVGKRGYIEFPSKIAELSFGLESRHHAGYSHHRWIIEIEGDKIIFLAKPDFIYACWKYHFPYRYGKRLEERRSIQYLFWTESFRFEERIVIDESIFFHEIEEFIRSHHVYPNYRYKIEGIRGLFKKIYHKLFLF